MEIVNLSWQERSTGNGHTEINKFDEKFKLNLIKK
jgi:hypothetical protein